MATEAERERAKKGIRARQDAIRSLIAAHQAEFDEAVTRNRLAAGLPARPQGATPEQIQAKIERAQRQMEKWREELRLTS